MTRVTDFTVVRTIRRALEESRSAVLESLTADASGDVAVKRLRRIVHAKKVTQALAQHGGPLAGYLRNVRIVLNRSDDPRRIIDALGPVVDAPELKQALRIRQKSRRAA